MSRLKSQFWDRPITRVLPVLMASAAVAAELPVQRVTIYSSGVACYERSGTVDDEALIEMPFKTEQMNDILKSLVLMDLGGGTIAPVVYASQDPIERSLKSFGIDLTQRPTLRQLLEQIRGISVELQLVDQTAPVTGKVIGTELDRIIGKDGALSEEVQYVTLACDDGIRAFKIRNLRGARILDEKLDAELVKALAVLAVSRDVGKKSVALKFTGQGKREVMAAYVLEAPVWKTSYRLVISDKDQPLLQGWATVDNTTDEDWRDVELTLVSGRPISFVQDLYSPLYVPRPEVKPEIYASLQPRKYEGDIEDEAMAEAVAPASPAPAAPSRRAVRGRPADAMAKSMQDLSGAPGSSEVALLGVSPASPLITAATAGVASMAEAMEAGELFRYDIKTPVSIGRQQSAMLPIANEKVEVEKISVFTPWVHAKYPLNGVQLTNSTKLHLMQGPVTVFDDGVYAGDARLDDLSPGEKRLVTYAMDLEREVVIDSQSAPSQILSLRIAKGTLIVQNKYEQKRVYNIKNKDAAARMVIVEQPYTADWKLVEPEKPDERTAQLYRFKVEAAGGKTTALTTREEQVVDQSIALTDTGLDAIGLYLRSKVISEKVRKALEEVVRMRTAIDQEQREAARLKAKLGSITQEQERLRANMGAVGQNSDLYKRYVTKLEQQETEIETTQAAGVEIEAKIEGLRRELESYLLNLDVQ